MIASALFTLIAATYAPSSLDESLMDTLAIAGLDFETARLDHNLAGFVKQGEFGTQLFRSIDENPWRATFHAELARSSLQASTGNPLATLALASRKLGPMIRRDLLGDPTATWVQAAQGEEPLRRALAQWQASGLADQARVVGLEDVPIAVQRAAAMLMHAVMDRAPMVEAAFADPAVQEMLGLGPQPATGFDPARHRAMREGWSRLEMVNVHAAAQDLAACVQKAAELVRSVDPSIRYRVEIPTQMGTVLLTGGNDDRHLGNDLLLVIDTGGLDVYTFHRSRTEPPRRVSIQIDTHGNDVWTDDELGRPPVERSASERREARERIGPAAAFLGVSLTWDLAGDDLWVSASPSFGSAQYGVAYLSDWEGDDRYIGYADSQGFGFFGIGVLEDSAGNDRYGAVNQMQGCGLPGGFGLLVDRAGDDRYLGAAEPLDFPSPQSAAHNVSMGQGAGYGFRHDFLTGRSISGGVGFLVDLAGDDRYVCGVFGQGTGYWEGVGFLVDAAGRDTYSGQWYVMGASAHFGVGLLVDEDGDDRYSAALNMALGAGHDFGYGILLDKAGNDEYQGPNLSLGAGNANGMGIFVDLAGNDRYSAVGVSLGQAAVASGGLRGRAFSLGLFLDRAGADRYPPEVAHAGDGKTAVQWATRGRVPRESQVGVFADR